MVHFKESQAAQGHFKAHASRRCDPESFFRSFLSEASIPILGVTQELFVAAGALWSIAASCGSPENQMKLYELEISEILSAPT